MQPGIRDFTIAVYELTVDAENITTNLRALAAHTETPLSTTQHRLQRAISAGLVVYEPTRSNTIRLAPGITVHNGEIYRLQTL